MSVLVSDMVSQVRIMSDLRQNQLFTDDQIVDKLNDADRELRDIIKDTNEHYLMSSLDFSLNGGHGVGNDTLNLPDDFIQGHSVDGFPDDDSKQYTVKYLQNWLERNRLKFAFRPKYFLRGKVLQMFPSSRAAGTYRLWYTAKATPLHLPKTVTFTMVSSDIPAVPPTGGLAGTGSWAFQNASTSADQPTSGFDLVLTFTSTNLSFSGTYHVVDLGLPPGFSRTTFGVSNLASTAGFTSPPTGTGTYTYQPVGTSATLDTQIDQFSMWHLLHASIAIRNARQQDVTDLDRKLNAPGVGYRAHIVGTVTNRTEEPVQPPLTRRDSFETDIGAWAEWPDAG